MITQTSFVSARRRARLALLLLVLLGLLGGLLLTACDEQDAQKLADDIEGIDADDVEGLEQDLEKDLEDVDLTDLESVVDFITDKVDKYVDVDADVLDPVVNISRGLAIIGGLALLVAGWKIYRFMVALPGLFIGGMVGAGMGASDGEVMALVGLVIGALIGAGLALLIHDLAVFLTGALIAGLIIGSMTNFDPPAVALIGGFIGGLIFLGLFYMLIVVVTSAVGASWFGVGIGVGGILIVIFFVCGIVIQFGLAKALGEEAPVGGAKRKREPART